MSSILIVDDLRANRDFLVTILRHQGHRMLEAGDGNEGLIVVRAERPDLVITDVLMPVMDGYELVRRLRLDPATSSIPVVFYTAHYGEREARALAQTAGVAAVLTKPAESATVLKVVGGVLSGQLETDGRTDTSALTLEFPRDHLRLITNKLSETTDDLKATNARLRALINIGLDLASERDADRLLQRMCVAARELFSASYVTLGTLNRDNRTLQRIVTFGTPSVKWIKAGDTVPGILGAVVSEGRTMRGDNRTGDPIGLQLPVRHPRVHAYLAAPIASPANVYGWICLVGNDGRTFSDDDEQLVLALAGHVGRIYELENEILERKHAESALRHERDRAQRYLDTADVILLALALNGAITLINRKGCDLLGWAEADLLGRDWIDTCLPVRIRERCRRDLGTLIGDEFPADEEYVLTKNGEERLIEWRNTLLRDDAGQVIGTFSSGTDITERSQAVQALRTAEERMRFALESANVGIWDLDYRTGILRWSEILEAHYGLQAGTFGGTYEAFIAHIHPEDRGSVREAFDRSLKTGVDFSIQNRAVWPDGTVRWLSGAGRVHLDEHGEPVRGVGISLDVTERRTLEEQYHQAQKMEAIGRLAGGVAHDFNNLLTVILGNCELSLADLPTDDPRYTDLTEIQKAGVSAAGLTRQLLAFSRKQIIEPTLIDLNVVVGDMRAMIGRLIGADVKVVLNLGPALAAVKADRGQVEQIVLNLAVNARDAMPNGGKLTIETANVELDEHYATTHLSVSPGPYVVLTMTDTGSGMTPEVQARLFEPFFTTKGIGKGTGLGLATVHGIVTRSAGSVHVLSELGRGSSFKVYFPRAGAIARMVEAGPPAPRRRATQTVLLVDDAEGLRELARRLLQRQGYTVLVAANADEALQLFNENPCIDVLLTDVVMPGASGPELTRRLVEQRPSLKVIYMSGYTEDAIVQHGVLNPGIAFLNKPFTSETLGRKIREVLDQ